MNNKQLHVATIESIDNEVATLTSDSYSHLEAIIKCYVLDQISMSNDCFDSCAQHIIADSNMSLREIFDAIADQFCYLRVTLDNVEYLAQANMS